MISIAETKLTKGKYEISLNKLFAGWTPESTSGESTIIREYVDYKSEYPLPKNFNIDSIASEYYEYGDIVWLCIHLLEVGIKKRKINQSHDITDIIALDYLISIKDEDEAHKILLKLLRFICK